MPSRSPSLADRLVHTGMALLVASLGIYAGLNRSILGRTGRGVELGEWSWFVGCGFICVAALGLIVAWWPAREPPA